MLSRVGDVARSAREALWRKTTNDDDYLFTLLFAFFIMPVVKIMKRSKIKGFPLYCAQTRILKPA
jgi:hypothetical protein